MKNSKRPLSASAWDSYVPTMYEVLDTIKPNHYFEWGSGQSTSLVSLYPTVESVDSVEHSLTWYKKVRGQTDEDFVHIVHSPLIYYAAQRGRYKKYDLIFVDGRRRFQCLINAHDMVHDDGVVMLHDAERAWYDRAVETYEYYIYTDNWSTVTMTNSGETYEKLRRSLSALAV